MNLWPFFVVLCLCSGSMLKVIANTTDGEEAKKTSSESLRQSLSWIKGSDDLNGSLMSPPVYILKINHTAGQIKEEYYTTPWFAYEVTTINELMSRDLNIHSLDQTNTKVLDKHIQRGKVRRVGHAIRKNRKRLKARDKSENKLKEREQKIFYVFNSTDGTTREDMANQSYAFIQEKEVESNETERNTEISEMLSVIYQPPNGSISMPLIESDNSGKHEKFTQKEMVLKLTETGNFFEETTLSLSPDGESRGNVSIEDAMLEKRFQTYKKIESFQKESELELKSNEKSSTVHYFNQRLSEVSCGIKNDSSTTVPCTFNGVLLNEIWHREYIDNANLTSNNSLNVILSKYEEMDTDSSNLSIKLSLTKDEVKNLKDSKNISFDLMVENIDTITENDSEQFEGNETSQFTANDAPVNKSLNYRISSSNTNWYRDYSLHPKKPSWKAIWMYHNSMDTDTPELEERGEEIEYLDATTRAMMPWVVAVLRYEMLWCGGTIVSDRHVLTAAHCLSKGRTTESASIFSVRAGSTNWRSGGQFVEVSQLRVHPEYFKFESTSFAYLNDVGLLFLSKHLTLGESVEFVGIATVNLREALLAEMDKELRCRVATYRSIHSLGQSRRVNPRDYSEAHISIVTLMKSESCNNLLLRHDLSLDEPSQMCTVCSDGGCSGEDGSGLICRINRIETLVAVTSYGSGCGLACKPTVYTKTDKSGDFIIETVRLLRGDDIFDSSQSTFLFLPSIKVQLIISVFIQLVNFY